MKVMRKLGFCQFFHASGRFMKLEHAIPHECQAMGSSLTMGAHGVHDINTAVRDLNSILCALV
jgi:hypothetical protein